VGVTSVWCEWALLPGGVAADVRIDVTDGRIAAVEAGAAQPPEADRRAGVTMPGAANAHSHAFHRALRGRSQAGRGSFWTWREQMYALAARLEPDTYHRLARAVFGEMVLAGYTSVGEFQYVHHRPDGTHYADPNAMGEALVAAAADAGIRITLLDVAYLHGGLGADGYAPASPLQRRFLSTSAEAWVERVGGHRLPANARLGAAIHSVRAVDPHSIATVAGWAADSGAPLHAHVSEQTAENTQCLAAHGCTPTELLADVVGGRFTAVHATHPSGHDIELLGRSGSTVCLCPTTERDLGDGVGPARALLDAGVTLAIGSDSHAVVDPFEEVRAIELDERLARRERGVVTVDELVAALGRGHRSLGWDDVGTIEAGQRADLVTVALDTPRTAGASPDAIAAAVVFAATGADVTDVMVEGADVVTGGRHRWVDVVDELRAAIAALVDEVPG
jgi:formiminoglutamate deiminase